MVMFCRYDISGVTEDELPYVYFNAVKRRPEQRKRCVEVSDAELQKLTKTDIAESVPSPKCDESLTEACLVKIATNSLKIILRTKPNT